MPQETATEHLAWHSLVKARVRVARAGCLRLNVLCEREGTMLKITKIDTPSEQKLILEGRLTKPWIADLRSQWEKSRHAHPERKFVVDLRGVMRIDSAGEGALALMKTGGAEFLATGIRMKHLLEDLEIEAPRMSTEETQQ
jgi:anti-anti-sigma regulatory factor